MGISERGLFALPLVSFFPRTIGSGRQVGVAGTSLGGHFRFALNHCGSRGGGFNLRHVPLVFCLSSRGELQ